MKDAHNQSSSPPACPRCPGVALVRSSDSSADIMFFECPSCKRQYAKQPGASLTYRWLHPVTLALYGVIFEQDPVPRAEYLATRFVRDLPRYVLIHTMREIELELNEPTQPVREALGNYATEEKCREFLKAFVSHVRSRL